MRIILRNIIINNKTVYDSFRPADYILDYTRISNKIKPFFALENFNYWDLLNYFLWHSSFYFRKKQALDFIFYYIDILDKKIDKKSKLIIQGDYVGTTDRIAILISNKKKIKLSIINAKNKRKYNFLYENPFLIRNLLRFRLLMRFFLGKIRNIRKVATNYKPKILLLSNIRFSKIKVEDNLMFGGVIKELLRKKISFKELNYETLTQTSNLFQFIRKFSYRKESYIGDYYTLKHFKSCENDFSLLKKRWDKVEEIDDFKSIFTYKGYNFYDIIKPRLELIFNALSYIAVDNKNITKTIIEKENYKVLIIDHEDNMYGKGFMLNVRTDSKKYTIALSHEIITPGCIHTHYNNKKVLDKKSVLWRPLPDVKCVWGEYGKKVLLDSCNYKKELIKITGNPKFDIILKKKYNKKTLLKKYSILKKYKKRILIASSFEVTLIDKCKKIYKEISQQNKEILIVFKPHPTEDMDMLKSILKDMPKNFFLVDKYCDIYELIYLSDYVITVQSTSGFEAMLFNKIVFILNYDNSELTGLPYVKNRAAIEINSANDFKDEILKLKNKKYEDNIRINMKKFADSIHYKNDGKASSRVIDIINKLLRK